MEERTMIYLYQFLIFSYSSFPVLRCLQCKCYIETALFLDTEEWGREVFWGFLVFFFLDFVSHASV